MTLGKDVTLARKMKYSNLLKVLNRDHFKLVAFIILWIEAEILQFYSLRIFAGQDQFFGSKKHLNLVDWSKFRIMLKMF